MYTRTALPDAVQPDELDRYLREGWFRIGQHMVHCTFVWSGDLQLRSAIWTRTRLDGFTWRRSHRRLMRRNLARFQVHERPLAIDGEHEDLYARYVEVARGDRSPTLRDALMAGQPRDRFATRLLDLRDGDGALVGFSVFDLGDASLQSLMGVYDPDHARDGLGFWTLLLEVEHARATGRHFHYAGYVLPGDPSMDYKLRVGHMEFLHPDRGEWRPWSEFEALALPSSVMEQRLQALVDALAAHGVPSAIRSYRMYEAPSWNPAIGAAVAHPRVVVLEPDAPGPALHIAAWDLRQQRYEVLPCRSVPAWAEARHQASPVQVELWIESGRGFADTDPDAVAGRIASWRRRRDAATG